MTGWHPIATAPYGEEVEVYYASSDYIGLATRYLGCWLFLGGRSEPTFWRPKPLKPLECS